MCLREMAQPGRWVAGFHKFAILCAKFRDLVRVALRLHPISEQAMDQHSIGKLAG